jgi:hypothetical protein
MKALLDLLRNKWVSEILIVLACLTIPIVLVLFWFNVPNFWSGGGWHFKWIQIWPPSLYAFLLLIMATFLILITISQWNKISGDIVKSIRTLWIPFTAALVGIPGYGLLLLFGFMDIEQNIMTVLLPISAFLSTTLTCLIIWLSHILRSPVLQGVGWLSWAFIVFWPSVYLLTG